MGPLARLLATACAFKFLDGFLLIYPLYAVMFVDHGLTPWQVSVTLIAWSTTAFLLQIPAGLLADRLSRRWLLCGAQVVRGLGFAAWLLFPGFAGFLIGLMLWGAKSAFTNGVFEALVYDELREAGRAEDYARVIGRAQGFGFAAILLASVSAAYVVRFGYPAALVASLAAALAAAVAAVALPRATRTLSLGKADYVGHLRQGFAYASRHPTIPGVILLLALSQAFGGGLEGFWPVFGREVGLQTSQVALLAAAIGAAQGAGAAVAHRFRRAPPSAFLVLFAGIGAVLILAAMVFQAWTVALVAVLAGLFKLIDINFDARLHDAIPSETRATLAATRNFAGLLALTVMLLGFGPLANATAYRTAFLGAGAAMVAIGLALLLARTVRRPA
ncbi:MFS transporter [Phenylobacterium sp.]|uniref:MFS transporter n=1 Tax=Phenylobacterium sp. TaxID=1871053 RepID=UPI0027342551|nr:MFS transporter [Phenylobacterium sp.]MDP3855885.1 MFS transporter [Phenylobacterium sp.]